MNALDTQYQTLLQDILANGSVKDTRNGKVISVFGRTIRHDMRTGFPVLTTKKMYLKGIIVELLWFLRGDTNIKWLLENDCNIWTGDAFQKYKNRTRVVFDGFGMNGPETIEEFREKILSDTEFASAHGELGPVYGRQWRNIPTGEMVTYGHNGIHTLNGERVIDQIADAIFKLKNYPDDRRIIVNSWNVTQIDKMTLPPCHYSFQFWTRELTEQERREIFYKRFPHLSVLRQVWHNGHFDEKNIPTRGVSLIWNQRSCDFLLGIPFNITSYGLLLEIIAKHVNMLPLEIIGNLGDTHLYEEHKEPAIIQLGRTHYDLPTLKISDKIVDDPSEYEFWDFTIENYRSHPAIKAKLFN